MAPERTPPTQGSVPEQAAATLTRLRRIIALLASGTAVGGLLELAALRHWHGMQLVPWVVLAVVASAGLVVAARPGPRILPMSAGLLGLAGGVLGIQQHVAANLALGPVLPETAATWESLGTLHQWWLAASGSVGATPALAPGMVALAGALLLVSTPRR